MKKTIRSLYLLLAISVVPARTVLADEIKEDYPDIKPEYHLGLGYTFVDHDGSRQAGEYEYMDDSLGGGGEFYAFPFPHRFFVEADFLNENDYFGEMRYAYKDLLLSRVIGRKLFHNLENYTLRDLDPATAYPGIDRRDRGETYGVEAAMNKYFLRVKAPAFPWHVYSEGDVFHKQGSRQQRLLAGTGYYNDVELVSTSRDIDQETKSYTFGTNSHLGPVEVDLSHTDQRFRSKDDEVLQVRYGGAGIPAGALRAPGIYPAGALPELKTSTNTLKVHTSLTGRIVAGATFTDMTKKNENSGAETDFALGYGEMVWIVKPHLTFSLKYSYQEADTDNPDSVTVVDQGNALRTYTYTDVRPSINYTKNRFKGSVRYKPLRGLALRTDYTWKRKEIDDRNALDWHLPSATTDNIYDIGGTWRALKNLKIKARYLYENTDHEVRGPVVNIDPETTHQGILSCTWLPVDRLTLLINYNLTRETTDELQILDSHGEVISDVRDAETTKQRALASATYWLSEKLSLTGSYAYLDTEVTQDLAYDAWAPAEPFADNGARSESKAHCYSTSLMYAVTSQLNVSAMVDYTESKGRFSSELDNFLDPDSITVYSRADADEWNYSLKGLYELENGWEVEMGVRYSDLDDDSYDNPAEGDVFSSQLQLSKRW